MLVPVALILYMMELSLNTLSLMMEKSEQHTELDNGAKLEQHTELDDGTELDWCIKLDDGRECEQLPKLDNGIAHTKPDSGREYA
jgi:hypothetical protein